MVLLHRAHPRKVSLLVVSLALVLSACGSSGKAEANADAGTMGPNAYTTEQQAYLDDITNADLAASIYLSATDYLTIADTVCNGLKQDIKLDEILSALATSGKQNGLNEDQRTVFSLYTSAAAVTYLCPDQKDKYKRDS
jgi:hypothetical protein